MELMNKVYANLTESTEALAAKIAECKDLEGKAKSGNYSPEYISKELSPKILELKTSIRNDKEAAISTAKGIVKEYQDELAALDDLKPDEITDDIKLLNVGITLKERDLKAILARNKGNATMTKLVQRYAEEKGIDLGMDRLFFGHQEEINRAGEVANVIHYYEKWIDKDNAVEMLNKFFNMA